MKGHISALMVLGVALLATPAVSAPLSLQQINEMSQYIDCKTNCDNGYASNKTQCMKLCPTLNVKWEKNGVDPVDRTDLNLALLELWDDSTLTKICYDPSGWVKPIASCGTGNCEVEHPGQCGDADGDGLRQWEENLAGTSDSKINAVCSTNAQCSFVENCSIISALGQARCVPRTDCMGSTCTAYHLELVEQNNSQVVVRVHYDYSPVQARVLDLYLKYNQEALSLLDARLLVPVIAAGKELQTSHTSEGYLRLVVLGSSSLKPIPFGPVVELVFSRTSNQQTKLEFYKNDTAQKLSQAPSNESVQNALTNDALWGSDVAIPARSANGPRLLLNYPFDELSEPLVYSDVKDSVELCGLYSSCSGLSGADKVKMLAQLETVQRGWSKVSKPISGVRDRAAYFDGREDHLELPLNAQAANERSYTLETWFYAESAIAEMTKVGQILFNQQTNQETTSYGVGLKRSATAGAVDLVWFTGNAEVEDSVNPETIATGLDVLDWYYLAMTVNEANGLVVFYLDGVALPKTATLTPVAMTSCPLPVASGSGFNLHKEGVDLSNGGLLPETVFFASTQNNLYGIERMDPNGFARQEVIREGTFQALDPDYSPVTGKLVYVSSETDNFEIWIANEDGSHARPITRGFGDTERSIFARRPRWAPDGSGIVFESNVYSLEYNHNWYGRTYQLYYLAYDAQKNEVVISDPAGGTDPLSELDYDLFAGQEVLFKVSLTRDSATNHYGVVWLSGSHAGSDLGRIAYTQADENFDGRTLYEGTILSPESLNAQEQSVPYESTVSGGQGAELLDVHVDPKTNAKSTLVARTQVGYRPTDQFKVESVVAQGTGYDVRVVFAPSGYTEDCWDLDNDGKCNSETENWDGNTVCDKRDCYPSEVSALYVAFPYDKARFNFGGSRVNSTLIGLNKDVELSESSTAYGEFVRILVQSPFSSRPLPAGLVATLHFNRVNGKTSALADYQVRNRSEKRDLVLGAADQWKSVTIPQLEEVTEARFSPDGKRLLVAGLENARPVVVLYDETLPPSQQVSKVSLVPQRVEGMSWNVGERFYPCQWVGATRNPSSKLLKRSFRGGLDEMRLYSYVRTAKAISSEFERGQRWLDKAGAAAKPQAQQVTCDKHSDCPDYQLCGGNGTTDPKGLCATVACLNDECPQGGECTLLPVPLGGGQEGMRFVCSADCSSDRECFEQDCRNGQCRFCDTGTGGTSTCLECRKKVVEIPGLQPFMEVEGCPDRNSFVCEDGSCYSECYAQENGQSRYLCAPGLEYCRQGRCMAIEWSWNDLSPSTMSGLAQMSMDIPNAKTTAAIPQLYPVTLKAYGVEDYLESPQVIIEGRVLNASSGLPQFYGTDWFEVGVVAIHNKSRSEADNNLYTVLSPYPMEEIRLRLISPPFENGNQGNHGLMNGEKDFCASWSTDRPECINRATGSRATIGYPVGIPRAEARRACFENGKDNAICQYQQDQLRPYLWGGQPAVVIVEAEVNGKNVFVGNWINKVCGYASKSGESTTVATRPGKKPYLLDMKRQVFGSLGNELSGQKSGGLHAGMTGPSALVDGKAMLGNGNALLNCTMADPDHDQMVAGATFTVCSGALCSTLYPNSGRYNGNINETQNGCYLEKDMRSKPCYEWMGGDATLDYLSAPQDHYRTLDYDTFRGHGH